MLQGERGESLAHLRHATVARVAAKDAVAHRHVPCGIAYRLR